MQPLLRLQNIWMDTSLKLEFTGPDILQILGYLLILFISIFMISPLEKGGLCVLTALKPLAS